MDTSIPSMVFTTSLNDTVPITEVDDDYRMSSRRKSMSSATLSLAHMPLPSHSSTVNNTHILDSLRLKLDVQYTPINSELGEWWDEHAHYTKFSRQGIDIIAVIFEQNTSDIRKSRYGASKAIANVVILNGWSDSFLRYVEIVKILWENGFNVHMFDYQSHGLSGRWLSDSQSLWVNSFDDYVDDFVYFTTLLNKEYPNLPLYVIGHCLGGLIASIAMSKLPFLVNRAVLVAPMLRMKCALQFFNYRIFLPQPLARWLAIAFIHLGMGTMSVFGFSKELSTDDPLTLKNITTSDEEQLLIWHSLKQRIPNIICSRVTFDWVYQAIHAQRKFGNRYEFVRTNTLILHAEKDKFVYDRAMKIFLKKTSASKMFTIKNCYHDIFHESIHIRKSATDIILNFFKQNSDNVSLVEGDPPLIFENEKKSVRLYSLGETIMRGIGLFVASGTFVIGCTLIISRYKRYN